MQKTAIVTIAIGKYHQDILSLTKPFMEDYAKRIKSDLIIIDKPSISETKPDLEIFQLFNLFNKYHRIMFIEADVLIRDDCENIFNIVPEDKIGLYNEGVLLDKSLEVKMIQEQLGEKINKWEKTWWSTAVIIASRRHKFLFEKPNKAIHAFSVEGMLNFNFHKNDIDVFTLHYKYCRTAPIDKLTGEHRLASKIIHYKMPMKELKLRVLREDIEEFKKNPEHKYKRNILIKVHGGLGDEVCAEPVIRHIIEKAYKNENIVIQTWFPRLFQHLPALIVDFNTTEISSFVTQPYVMESMLSPETPMWLYASANLMNCVDFCSLSCLRMILPDKEKQPKLLILEEDIQEAKSVFGNIEDYILVHPGKGWDSKTFPAEYWSDVLKELKNNGFEKVAVIGKHISNEQGTVDIKIPDGVLDARNLLSLGGLMAAISKAKILISNDSAPVHIAGAFDNWIILIPTCKHPDHVLHIRQGTRQYKTKIIYKRLMVDDIESTPTQIHGQTIDYVPGNILDFIPNVEEVIKTVKEIP